MQNLKQLLAVDFSLSARPSRELSSSVANQGQRPTLSLIYTYVYIYIYVYMCGGCPKSRVPFAGTNNKDYGISGSPYFGKLQYKNRHDPVDPQALYVQSAMTKIHSTAYWGLVGNEGICCIGIIFPYSLLRTCKTSLGSDYLTHTCLCCTKRLRR